MAADRVDFVDEDDARRVALRLFEHVADAARTHTDEHFDEVRTRDGEDGDARLPRDRAGEQGLAGAGRAAEQSALRNLAAELLIFGRVSQGSGAVRQLLAGLLAGRPVL